MHLLLKKKNIISQQVCVCVCVATEDIQKGKSILNSDCTFHVSLYKSYFSSYHEFDRGRVMMRNNSVYKIIGMGKIYFKLHDGSIREVRQVRHVPDLKRNLISYGMMDQWAIKLSLNQVS